MRFAPLDDGPLAAAHAAFVGADAIDWSLAPAVDDYALRESGRRTFVHRALDEQRSLLAFSELLTAVCRTGAPIDVIGALTRVVRDEALHVELCGRMVERLGGWPEAPRAPRVVSFPAEWSDDKRVLATVLGSLCVGETLSVALFRRARESATDPVARAVLTRMLADESFHARFGFWWLDAVPRPEAARRWAERFLGHVLESVVTDFLPTQTAAGLARDGLPDEATPFGGVSAAERREAVIDAIEGSVVPGLERAGLPAKRLWAHALSMEGRLS